MFKGTVLRFALGDCTNGGASSDRDSFYLLDLDEVFPAALDPDRALRLVRRTFGGEPYYHAEPVDPVPPGSVGWMHGGNFLHVRDGSFPIRYPIAIHDRSETEEEDRALSI